MNILPHIDNDKLDVLFPFHFIADESLLIVKAGKGLLKLYPEIISQKLSRYFIFKRPFSVSNDFDSILSYSNQIFILENIFDSLLFRGQIIHIKSERKILFIVSPWITNVEDLKKHNLLLTDFALHDTITDMLQLLKSNEIAMNDVKELIANLNLKKNALEYSEEKLRKSEKHLKIQYQISQQLSTSATVNNTLYKIIETVCTGINWKCGSFWSLDNEADALLCMAYWQSPLMKNIEFQKITESIPFISGIGLPGRVWKTKKTEWIPDVELSTNFFRVEYAVKNSLHGAFAIPVLFDNTVIGVLEFFCSEVCEPDMEFIEMLEASAQQIGQFIIRKKIEEKSKENERKYKQLVEEASDIIYKTNYKGFFVYVNSITARIMQVPENKIIGKHFTELVRKDHREKVEAFYREQFETNTALTYFEFPAIGANGEDIWIGQNVTIIYNGNKIEGFQAVARDITDRKNAEEKIKLSEEKFRNIIENMELGLLEVNAEDIIIQPNEKFCEMTGYTKEELTGKSTIDILFTGKKFKSRLSLQNIKKMLGKTNVYEIQMKKKNGGIIWALISEAPLYNINRSIIGSIGIYLDITERKNHEEELRRAKEFAEHSKKVKEQFLANMSHEIRTPMNAIIGMADMLHENSPDPEHKECINAIKLSADNLLSIINDILDFSKIESGKILFERTPFKLKTIIESIIQTIHFTAREKSIALSYSISDNVPPVIIGDIVRLRQVLLNLCSNAIKFTDKGDVKIEIKLQEHNNDDYIILFTVTDTGIGIPEEKLSTIFESFTQASGDTTRKYGGTGLGLTITKQLIELQGGSIFVKSKINEGSKFSFNLPFKAGNLENEEAEKKEKEFSYTGLEGIKVLLVEDNLMNQLLVKKILMKWNIEFDIANNGKIAIDKLSRNDYNIILMDMHMPEMDGYQAAKHIREKMVFPKSNTPIIAVTANAIIGEEEKCIATGMNDYISKPLNKKILYQKITKLIGKKDAPKKDIFFEKSGYEINDRREGYADLTYLREIAEGSNEFMVEMINSFLADMPNTLENMDKFLVEKKWKELKVTAHTMKSTINFIGIHSIKEVVRNIEKFAEEQTNLQSLPHLIAQTKNACIKAMEELKTEIEKLT